VKEVKIKCIVHSIDRFLKFREFLSWIRVSTEPILNYF